MKKKIINFILIFTISFIIFFGLTIFSNNVLSTFDVTSVRFSSAMNPILGIAFGWPAILGCAFANFACDLMSPSYGLQVALIGILPQIFYGALPYFVWRKFVRTKSHITRLDSPKKTIIFALLMVVNSCIVGVFVGVNQYVTYGNNFWEITKFASINDFDMCMIVGLPLMSIIDYFTSKILYTKKRVLSVNEKIILVSSGVQVLLFFIIAALQFIILNNVSTRVLWKSIFDISSYVVNIVILLSLVVMYFVSLLKKKHATLRIFEKQNGTIFVDEDRKMEFISYPGRDLENSIKSDAYGFGYSHEKRLVKPSFETAWYCALSNQHGCPMKCTFCDCAGYGYYGNITRENFKYQIENIINNTGSTFTKWFEVDFMRMGEPSLNPNILPFIEYDLRDIVRSKVNADVIYPTISTMCPKFKKDELHRFLLEAARIKNEVYDGNMAIQLSISTTDENLRKILYKNLSLTIAEIGELTADMPIPKGRKYQLNFPITKDSIVEADVIDKYFDKNKFIIKFTPLHETDNAIANGYKITTEYSDFEVFKKFETKFLALGWDVMTFLDKKEEDDDSLTCGNLLLMSVNDKLSDRVTNKKRIGILVAIEINAIFELYDNVKELPSPPGFKLYLVEKDKYMIFICQSGMGECASSAGVQFLISNCKVEMIVNFGVVGGLTTDMKKQKVALVNRVVHYKYDCSEFMDLAIGQVDGHDSIFLKTDPTLIKNALMIDPTLPLVTCASGDKFISTAEEKDFLHRTFEGDICDMESSGIVLTCEANDVPCIMFKAVADGLADGAAGYFAELESASLNCLKVASDIMDKIALIEK